MTNKSSEKNDNFHFFLYLIHILGVFPTYYNHAQARQIKTERGKAVLFLESRCDEKVREGVPDSTTKSNETTRAICSENAKRKEIRLTRDIRETRFVFRAKLSAQRRPRARINKLYN